jgi:hypothetical protein
MPTNRTRLRDTKKYIEVINKEDNFMSCAFSNKTYTYIRIKVYSSTSFWKRNEITKLGGGGAVCETVLFICVVMVDHIFSNVYCCITLVLCISGVNSVII